MKMVIIRKRALLAALTLVGGVGFALFIGQQLVAPSPRIVGAPAKDFNAETISFPSKSGSTIVGWLSEVQDAQGAVLLLHGLRGDRRNMIGRARFLAKNGYNTLCIDLQAHGESKGEQITMG